MPKQLLIDICEFKISLNESSKKDLGNGRIYIEGRGQMCGVKNRNNRRYPEEKTFGRIIKEGSPFMERVKRHEVFGHLEHPESGRSDLRQAAIKIEKAWLNGGGEVGVGLSTLSTSLGKDATALFNDGLTVGISSRGTGTVTAGADGVDEVQDDYELETWDLVADPSTPGAQFVAERIMEAYKRLDESNAAKCCGAGDCGSTGKCVKHLMKEEEEAKTEAKQVLTETRTDTPPSTATLETPPGQEVVLNDAQEEEETAGTSSSDELEEQRPFRGRERNTRMSLPPDLEFVEDDYPIDIWKNNIIWNTVDGFVTMDFKDRDTADAIEFAINKKRPSLKTKIRTIPAKGIHRLRVWGNRHWSESKEEEMKLKNKEIQEANALRGALLVKVDDRDFRDFDADDATDLASKLGVFPVSDDMTGDDYLVVFKQDMGRVKNKFMAAGAKLREAEMTDELKKKIEEATKSVKQAIYRFNDDRDLERLAQALFGSDATSFDLEDTDELEMQFLDTVPMRNIYAMWNKDANELVIVVPVRDSKTVDKFFSENGIKLRSLESTEAEVEKLLKEKKKKITDFKTHAKEQYDLLSVADAEIAKLATTMHGPTSGKTELAMGMRPDLATEITRCKREALRSYKKVGEQDRGTEPWEVYLQNALKHQAESLKEQDDEVEIETPVDATVAKKQTVIEVEPLAVPGAQDCFSAKDTLTDLLAVNHDFDVIVVADEDEETVYVINNKPGDDKKIKDVLKNLGVEVKESMKTAADVKKVAEAYRGDTFHSIQFEDDEVRDVMDAVKAKSSDEIAYKLANRLGMSDFEILGDENPGGYMLVFRKDLGRKILRFFQNEVPSIHVEAKEVSAKEIKKVVEGHGEILFLVDQLVNAITNFEGADDFANFISNQTRYDKRVIKKVFEAYWKLPASSRNRYTTTMWQDWLSQFGITEDKGRIKEAARPIPSFYKEYARGFWGTLLANAQGDLANRDVQKIWDAMFKALAKKRPQASSEAIRNFLDSKYGRHLADQLGVKADDSGDPDSMIRAISSAAARWVERPLDDTIQATISGEWEESESNDKGKKLDEATPADRGRSAAASEAWAVPSKKEMKVDPQDFLMAFTELEDFSGKLAKIRGKGNTFYLVHDGKRAVFTDPQGYDYARYMTPMMTLRTAREVAKTKPEWFGDIIRKKSFSTGKVVPNIEQLELLAYDMAAMYNFLESKDKSREKQIAEINSDGTNGSTDIEKEAKLQALKREKFKEDCHRYLEIEEATKTLIGKLSERNKELQEAVDEKDKTIAILDEMNQAMDALKRREAIIEAQNTLLREYPQLEKTLHILNKAETIDDMQRTAKELLHLLKEQEAQSKKLKKKKEEVKKIDRPSQSDTIEGDKSVKVDSASDDLTEGVGDSLSRLSAFHRFKR